MSREVGLYTALALLLIAALALGMMFHQKALMEDALRDDLQYRTLDELASSYGNEHAIIAVKREQQMEKQIESIGKKIENLESELAATTEARKTQENLNAQFKQQLEDKREEVARLDQEVAESKAKVAELQDKLAGTASTEIIDQLKNEIAQLKLRADNLNREAKRELQARRAEQDAFKRKEREYQAKIDQLREALREYQNLDAKRTATSTEIHDGKILEVDIDRNFAVINLGAVHRVRRGMRFDVIRWRRSSWEKMGAIEITKVFPSTSTATIIANIKRKLRCPMCGFIGSKGMHHCPYCSTGEDGSNQKIVELVGGEVTERKTMNPLDPIVSGDYITNPFYSRERELKFTIAGDPQEYDKDELQTLIERYGGNVLPEVTVETDYLVLCRIPDKAFATTDERRKSLEETEKAQEMAKQYGIPIMREVELLDYLRH